jgi:hypothetical protein
VRKPKQDPNARHWSDTIEDDDLRAKAKAMLAAGRPEEGVRQLMGVFTRARGQEGLYPEQERAVEEGREISAKIAAERVARDLEFQRTHDRYGNVIPASRTRA